MSHLHARARLPRSRLNFCIDGPRSHPPTLPEQATDVTACLAGQSWLEARRGAFDASRAHAHEALAIADEHHLGFHQTWAMTALAEIELGLGRTDAALERFRAIETVLTELGLEDVDISPAAEMVEAMVHLGMTDEASALAASLTERAETKDLAARARSRKLKPDEYQGGTTAVSNLGMYGIKDFTAVINPPHATILAVGTGEERAVVRNGKIEVATVMSVTLSCDHRAVDGALGAELITAFKALIENPVMMVV